MVVDVYCNFILRYFDNFSLEGWFVYFGYICDFILVMIISKIEKERLLICLKNIVIVIFDDGSLKMVFFFYDFCNDVFKVMVFNDKFLLEFFVEEEWLLFMK